MNTFSLVNKAHFIGIGGIGMSGIAQLLLGIDVRVSGSDLKDSALIQKLRTLGAQVFIGHCASNIKDADLIIYSAAIKEDNPELSAARSQRIPILTRAQALAILANQKKTIAVTGAHGKTTTTSLISHLLVECNLAPTVCVGGELFNLVGNAFLGAGHYFVVEADESDGSFLHFQPVYAVVTNIDKEHLDYYRDLQQITDTFLQFMSRTRNEGCVFFCADDSQLRKIVPLLQKRCFSFGLSNQADIFPVDIKMQDGKASFNCIYQGQNLGNLLLNVPGRHNICNALVSVALGLELGLEFAAIQDALGSFMGVKRRLELKLREKDILIFDDYAHHPTEIRATLEALRSYKHNRLVVVFQPHRYSRTKFLINDFGNCFDGVDQLIVSEIYSASEPPLAGISARSICAKAEQARIKDVQFLPKRDILDYLSKQIQGGDLIAVLGAGDIGSIADALVKRVKGASTL